MSPPSLVSFHDGSHEQMPGAAAEIADVNFWQDYAVEMPAQHVTGVAYHERCAFAGGIMGDLIFKLTVNQLAATIREQGIDREATAMLDTLESLVIAGEIAFPDFMGRVQNLFADAFDRMDASLLEKLSSLASD